MKPDYGRGSGSALNPAVLICAGVSALLATIVASLSIFLQLKNYRKPILQRQVVRIMLMVPIYAISSFISLISLDAAVVIDAVRDIYEAFVIYNFFHLLVDYLGGERSLLILLYGRPPKRHLFPVNIFKQEIDVSDPFTFLFIKRGILQYVQIKPLLAAVTIILKAVGKFNDGDLKADGGYLYVSLIYNVSICLSLYCLAMFWVVINDDVKPFRPMPKFLCIKGILFFCFWQTFGVSILVKSGAITHVGPYKDIEHISLAISDTLICFEMPIFAIAHLFAFSHTDYIDPDVHFAARMPFYYAVRDAFGLLDVLEDSRATFRGGVSYRTFEPAEGGMHVGSGRDRRIRAGLRYAKGGKQKYWLPMPTESVMVAPSTGILHHARQRLDENQGYAPLLAQEEEEVVHEGPNTEAQLDPFIPDYNAQDDDGLSLEFGTPDNTEDAMYTEGRKLLFGDYNYPTIDVSTERARLAIWDEEERILRDERAAAFTWSRGVRGSLAYPQRSEGYGATDMEDRQPTSSSSKQSPSVSYSKRKQQPHPAIIDYDQERIPDIDVEAIRLKWTKRGAAVPKAKRSSPKIATKDPQPQHVPKPDCGEEDATGLPEDAVDLIVEDPIAAQSAMDQERKRGEPAMHGGTGIKKIYRRKYKADNEGGAEEIDIEEERDVGDSPNALPDKTKVRVRSGSNGDVRGRRTAQHKGTGFSSPWARNSDEELFSPKDEMEVTIVRQATPPPHARVEINNYRSSPSDDVDTQTNPWI